MKKPKADPFATIDTGALANVTGGYVAGPGGQMPPPYTGESGSGSGSSSGSGHHHHHHHHGGCGGGNNAGSNGGNNGGSGGNTLNPIQLSWGSASADSSTA